MMLTGKSAHTNKAKKLGIVDAVTRGAPCARPPCTPSPARTSAGSRTRPEGRAPSSIGPARRLAAGRCAAQTEDKAPREHYPAPHALIDLWEEHGGDRDAMQKAEIGSFAQLLDDARPRRT